MAELLEQELEQPPELDNSTDHIIPRQKGKRVNYALGAILVAQHVTYDEAAKLCGAANGNVLKVGLSRLGVTATQARQNKTRLDDAVQVANRAISDKSNALREGFANVLAKHTAKLEQVPARTNLKHIAAVGYAMEPLARIAKIVHDWGNETKSGLIILGVVEQLSAKQDALEVSSSVSQATTESVPISTESVITPQEQH